MHWQDTIAIPKTTPPVVVSNLDERILWYFGLPEQIHTNQDAQFESQWRNELCWLWKVAKMHTISYYVQANGVVKHNNR